MSRWGSGWPTAPGPSGSKATHTPSWPPPARCRCRPTSTTDPRPPIGTRRSMRSRPDRPQLRRPASTSHRSSWPRWMPMGSGAPQRPSTWGSTRFDRSRESSSTTTTSTGSGTRCPPPPEMRFPRRARPGAGWWRWVRRPCGCSRQRHGPMRSPAGRTCTSRRRMSSGRSTRSSRTSTSRAARSCCW